MKFNLPIKSEYISPLTNCWSNVYCCHYIEVLKSLPDKYLDWIIVDIPYGIDVANMAFLRETKTTVKQKNGTKLNGHKQKIRDPYTQSDWDKEVPGQDFFDEIVRVSKNQIIFGIEYTNWKNVGKGRIIWNKGVPKGMSFKPMEVAYCSSIDYDHHIYLLYSGMNQAKSLSEPMVQQGNKKLNEKRIHPCYKPTMLYKKLFLDFVTPGQTVGETHLGGGGYKNCGR